MKFSIYKPTDSKIKKLEEKLQEAKAQAAHEKQKCEEQR